MDDIVLLIVVLLFCIMAILSGNNCIGAINRSLEIIKPKMRKVKLLGKLKYYIPQWCKQGGVDPPGAIRKSEVYILTLVLAICNYIFHALCFISAIIVFMLVPSAVVWIFLPIGCFVVVFIVIHSVTEFWENKIEKKNQGRLNRDFTIEKHDKKD